MPRRIGALQAAQEALDKGWYGQPAYRRIDAQSAGLILRMAEKLSPEHRAKLDALPVREAALRCYELLGAIKERRPAP